MNAITCASLVVILGLVAGDSGIAQQVSGQDLDKILERADKVLEEAKTAYEEAHAKSSVPMYVEAGFKLEDARIKYIVLQEVGSPEKQKIAADRLRSVNQLSKLIHDGKVAISGAPGEGPVTKPVDPPAPVPGNEPAPNPAAPPAKEPVVDVTKRFPVPEPAKQREAEKLIKDLFKDQYAKKSPADRKALSRQLLVEAAKSLDNLPAAWVLFREAQDLAVQGCDVGTAVESIESAARRFDVDALVMKSAALASASKAAKTPEEFTALVEALLRLIDDLVRADQYEPADKAAALAVQHARKASNVSLFAFVTNRAKEVTEAKTRYQAMKGVLETIAKNPDDPAANLEMGQFLCFVKASWDLGLRFLAKGSDNSLKTLASQELALPSQPGELMAVADGWWDLAEKEKSPLRKTQMLAHTKPIYESLLASTTGITRTKVEKRLSELEGPGPANLMRLIDPKVDSVAGQWRLESGVLSCSSGPGNRLQIPYQAPEEYDLTVSLSRKSGIDAIIIGLTGGGSQFAAVLDVFPTEGKIQMLQNFDGGAPPDKNPSASRGTLFVTGNQSHTVVCSVRKKGVTVTVDGKKAISWEGDYKRLSSPPIWKVSDPNALFIGAWATELQVTKILLTPVTGQGKRLR